MPAAVPAAPARPDLPRRVSDRWPSFLSRPFGWLVAIAAALFLVAIVALAGRCALSVPSLAPVQLYNALLDSPVEEAELPAGFSPDKAPYAHNDDFLDQDREFHALGEVTFDFSGPSSEADDFISYTVFPSDADAQGSWRRYSSILTPSGFRESVKCDNGTGTSGNDKYGDTYCAGLAGNVYVYSESRISGDTQDKGNLNSATTLLRLGLTHLQRVRSKPPSPLSNAAPVMPTPMPAATATPAATTRAPTPATARPGSSQAASNDVVSVGLGSGWSLDQSTLQTDSFSLDPPSGLDGFVFISSDRQQSAEAPPSVLRDLLQGWQKNHPNAKFCSNNGSYTIGGVSGVDVQICDSSPVGSSGNDPQGIYWAGTNSANSVSYVVIEWSSRDGIDALSTAAESVLDTLTWKLR